MVKIDKLCEAAVQSLWGLLAHRAHLELVSLACIHHGHIRNLNPSSVIPKFGRNFPFASNLEHSSDFRRNWRPQDVCQQILCPGTLLQTLIFLRAKMKTSNENASYSVFPFLACNLLQTCLFLQVISKVLPSFFKKL